MQQYDTVIIVQSSQHQIGLKIENYALGLLKYHKNNMCVKILNPGISKWIFMHNLLYKFGNGLKFLRGQLKVITIYTMMLESQNTHF